MGLSASKRFFASVRYAVFVAIFLADLAPLRAQQMAVTLDPASTEIHFTLGATMHTVHGVFKLTSGQIQWDPLTGRASGAIVIDATSGSTDNTSRDKNMHAQVLESARFPEIVFRPSAVKGRVAAAGASQVDVAGVIVLHGMNHDETLECVVQPAGAGQLEISTQLAVPFKTWGLKDPSTFLLHVADTVKVEVHALARIMTAP